MKKILLALSIALVLGLSGCGIYMDTYEESPYLHSPTILSSTSIQLSWSPISKTLRIFTWYRITRTREDGECIIYDTDTSAISWIDTGLDADTNYTYEIQARTIDGYSWPSNSVEGTTLESTEQTLPRPSPIRAEAAPDNPRDIILSWDEQPNATGYRLYTITKGGFVYPQSVLLATIEGTTSHRLYGQATAETYIFSMQAINTTNGSYSKTSEMLEFYLSRVDSSEPEAGTQLRTGIKEYFEVSAYDPNDFWAWFLPEKSAFNLSISSPYMAFRVFKENDDKSLSYLGYGSQGTPFQLRDSTLIGSRILVLMFRTANEHPHFYVELNEED